MIHGMYKLVVPIKYISEGASEADRKTYETYKAAFFNCMEGKQSGMTFPALTDENGNYLFDVQYVGPSSITIINNSPDTIQV